MAEYKTRYSREQKRRKLAKFNSVYYEGNPDNWKVSRLPNWMNFYGHSLNNELNGRLPRYYRKFKQGTIVMVDYGVPIGNELGGKHFGVITSNNDTKYKRKVTIIPLSSHYHKGYVDLGFDLMEGINSLLSDRIDELQNIISNMITRLDSFKAQNANKKIDFTQEDFSFLKENNVDYSLLQNDITIKFFQKDEELEGLVTQIKETTSWESHSNIFEFVSLYETIMNFQQNILNDLAKESRDEKQLQELIKKLNKYNKQSFAVISDIKSISKLRVTKLSHFTISGNTRISDKALNKIKTELIKTID